MLNKVTGTIISLQGQVAQVSFIKEVPGIYEVLEAQTEKGVARLMVFTSAGDRRVYALSLTNTQQLSRGCQVEATGKVLEFPVGRGLLGRVVNMFGEPLDKKGVVASEFLRPIQPLEPMLDRVVPAKNILMTGIKVIDLLPPS